MKEVILVEENKNTIDLWRVDTSRPIFAKKGGKLVGMLLRESDGWVVRYGDGRGVTGHYSTKKECLASTTDFSYTFRTK